TEDADRVLLEVHEWLESATASRSAGDAWPPPLDLATLAMTEPRAPSFIVKGWLPAGAATLMSGHGGMGKSNIALHLLAAMALGLPWHGVPTRQRRVLFLAAEDRAEVLHWRLSHIARHLDVSIADLAGRLHLVDLVGRDAVLWHSACLKGGTCTPGFERLRRLMRDTGAEVLAVDGVSDTFAGSEIARAEVRAYIASLLSLIDAERGALLLLGHVDKTSANGNATSNGYSGSTAWHNSVRSRWYLYPEGGAQGTGDLLLEQQKSNHGPGGGSLRLAWDREARMFLGREVVAATAADARARNRRQQQSIIESLRSVIASGDYCPSATQGQRTAYHVLSQRAEFDHQAMPDTKAGKRLFWSHIEAMRAIGEIREGSIKREDRHTSSVLELNPARGAPAENAGNA
ncbi:MAG: AAA family ATPase, partial [Reyranellaceae bacterium]